MLKNVIGTNAGIIWQYLDTNGGCPTNKLIEHLKMNEKEFYMALGWLTRENKVAYYEKEKIEYVYLYY
jgi:hypothetical protein